MANMSYCKFRNTLQALEDCESTLEENSFDFETLMQELSIEEYAAMKRLVKLASRVADRMSEEPTPADEGAWAAEAESDEE